MQCSSGFPHGLERLILLCYYWYCWSPAPHNFIRDICILHCTEGETKFLPGIVMITLYNISCVAVVQKKWNLSIKSRQFLTCCVPFPTEAGFPEKKIHEVFLMCRNKYGKAVAQKYTWLIGKPKAGFSNSRINLELSFYIPKSVNPMTSAKISHILWRVKTGLEKTLHCTKLWRGQVKNKS